MRDPKDFEFSIAGYVAWLCSLDGISARKDPEEYASLVAPCGPASARKFLSGPTPPGAPNSGCMVVQCGAVELFFTAHEKQTPLASPVGFDRWSVMTHWASRAQAILAPGQWSPEPGDIALMYAPLNHQHWIGLTSQSSDGAWLTIEGGRLDGAFQCVRGAHAMLRKEGSVWRDDSSYWHAQIVQIIRVRTLIEKEDA